MLTKLGGNDSYLETDSNETSRYDIINKTPMTAGDLSLLLESERFHNRKYDDKPV